MEEKRVEELNELNFEAMVARRAGTVLVDFTATWCPPCKALAPVVARVADETWGQVAVGSVDVDANPGLAAKFQIRGLPTLVVFRNGKEVSRRIGLTNENGVRALLANASPANRSAVA